MGPCHHLLSPLLLEKGGQPVGEVGPVTVVAEVTPGAPSSILAKRKLDDGVGLFGHKNSRAPVSLPAPRQAVGLTPGVDRPSSL